MTKLPDKPSELILLALDDLEKVEKSPLYEVNMYSWHEPAGDYCSVCLAGSVMAMTLGTAVMRNTDPADYEGQDREKLRALNLLRMGSVTGALLRINHKDCSKLIKKIKDRDITPYERNPDAFKADMRKLAAEFEEQGF